MSGNDNLLKAKFLKEVGQVEESLKFAVEDCKTKIASNKFKEALKIKKDFNIATSVISDAVDRVIRIRVRQNKLEFAARIGKQFSLPRDT